MTTRAWPECQQCGKVAIQGISSQERTSSMGRIEGFLSLLCADKNHRSWIVAPKCPECGKIPDYKLRRWGKNNLPVLSCCGKSWVPGSEGGERMDNPFLDERAI